MDNKGKLLEQCIGCENIIDNKCRIWVSPEARFRVGRGISCGSATHIMSEKQEDAKRVRAGQQKTKAQKAMVK